MKKLFIALAGALLLAPACQKENKVSKTELTTGAVTAITATTATLGGNITNEGNPAYTERGVCYSVMQYPTLESEKVQVLGTGTGDFNAQITDLTANTLYFVRAYAISDEGTVYGNEVSFLTTTADSPPSPELTTALIQLTSSVVTLGGNITNAGSPPYTERGVCYSTADNPTVEDSKIVDSGAGTGGFTVALRNLPPNTQYFARTYVICADTPCYADEINFTTPPPPGLTIPITDYGALPTNTADANQAAIQAAINALPAVGGTVYVPPGVFVTKPVTLRSDMTLYIEEGGVIKGTTNWRDYATGNPNNGEEGWLWEDCFIRIPDNSQNVTVDGAGTIDGSNCQNLDYGENGNRGPHIFHIVGCTNLTVKNITLQNSGNYNFRFDNCNNVLFENLTLLKGQDGFHSQDSENVTINNCTLKTMDSNIAGTGNENWLIENTSLMTNGGGMLIGCLNLTVQNCHFGGDFQDQYCFKGGNFPHEMANAVRFFSPNGRNNRFDSDNWLFKDCTIDQVGRFFYVNRIQEPWQVDKTIKSVRFINVKATNLFANDPAQGGSYGGQSINFVDFAGTPVASRSINIYMDSCSIQYQPGATGTIILASDFDIIEIHNSSFTGGVAGRTFIDAKNGNTLVLDNVTGNGGAITTSNITQLIK